MKVSKSVKLLAMLAAVLTLIVASPTPASAGTGYWYVGNEDRGCPDTRTSNACCLDYSPEFDFRVFQCNNNPNYQWMWFQNMPAYGADAYRIEGKTRNGGRRCLEVKGLPAFGSVCDSTNALQIWIVRDGNTRPYFESFLLRSQCLTKSTFEDSYGAGGNVLTVEPCAGRQAQYWMWLPS